MRSGRVRELPVDGYYASFKDEDGRRHDGPTAVIRKADARAWLSTATKRRLPATLKSHRRSSLALV